jgi:hypothetical protein
MKKIILVAFLALGLVSCGDNRKIDSEIDKKMSETLKDYSSYEPMETKTTDTIYVGDIAKNQITDPVNLRHPSVTKMAKFKALESSKEVLSYVVSHKYRAKNGLGALDIYEEVFVFDKNLKLFGQSHTGFNDVALSTQLFYKEYIN